MNTEQLFLSCASLAERNTSTPRENYDEETPPCTIEEVIDVVRSRNKYSVIHFLKV
jgi:hypothetical protein